MYNLPLKQGQEKGETAEVAILLSLFEHYVHSTSVDPLQVKQEISHIEHNAMSLHSHFYGEYPVTSMRPG